MKALLRRKGMMTFLDQVVVSLTNFSTGILIGHFGSKSELGLYMLGYSVLLLALALQQMMISSPYILHWPRLNGESAHRYTMSTYAGQFLFAMFFAACMLLSAGVSHMTGSALTRVLLAFACAGPCFLFREMYRRVCFTQFKVLRALAVDTGVCVAQVILLFSLLRTHHLTAPTGILSMGISNGLLALFLLRGKRVLPTKEDLIHAFRHNWEVARWIFGSQVLWASCLYAYPWLISHFNGTAAAGVWAACFGINALGNPLLLGLQSYIEPRVAHTYADQSGPEAGRFVWRATLVVLVSMLTFTAMILVVGNRAVMLLYGPKYAGNGLTITLITLSYALGAAGFAFSCGFYASGRGRMDYLISWIYPAGFILCAIPLVTRSGPEGGALALVITNGCSTALRAFQFYRSRGDGKLRPLAEEVPALAP